MKKSRKNQLRNRETESKRAREENKQRKKRKPKQSSACREKTQIKKIRRRKTAFPKAEEVKKIKEGQNRKKEEYGKDQFISHHLKKQQIR